MKKVVLIIFFIFSLFLIENYYSNTIVPLSKSAQSQAQYNMSSYDYAYDFISVDSIEEYDTVNKGGAIVANPLNQGESTVYYQLVSGDYESEVLAKNPIEITQNINSYASAYYVNISQYNQLNFTPSFGDNTYLDVYNKDLVAGTLSNDTNEVVIDTLSAQIYFDTSNYENIIGKDIVIAYENVTSNKVYQYTLEVVGVYKYEPYNDSNFFVYSNPTILPNSQTTYYYEDLDEEYVSYYPTFLVKLPTWEQYPYQQKFLSQFNENYPFYNVIIFPANSGISGIETATEYETYPNVDIIITAIGFIQIIVAMIILFFVNYKFIRNRSYYAIELIILIPLLIIFSLLSIISLNRELIPVNFLSYICIFIPFVIIGIIFSFCFYKND